MLTKNILIIDDDKVLTKMLSAKLEPTGYIVSSAHDGKDGLEKAINELPDLIILDISMPEMDGYSLLKELRARDKTADLPVIILSAKEKAKMEELFYFEKISGYFEKPFRIQDLLLKIKEVIGKNE